MKSKELESPIGSELSDLWVAANAAGPRHAHVYHALAKSPLDSERVRRPARKLALSFAEASQTFLRGVVDVVATNNKVPKVRCLSGTTRHRVFRITSPPNKRDSALLFKEFLKGRLRCTTIWRCNAWNCSTNSCERFRFALAVKRKTGGDFGFTTTDPGPSVSQEFLKLMGGGVPPPKRPIKTF